MYLFFELYAFIRLTSTLVLGINYFFIRMYYNGPAINLAL